MAKDREKEINKYGKDVWEKKTIIKDMVHGYINVPKPIVKEIIDSEQFQRLKDIEQTGMEALYPSATHKRFTHSLGVYHLAKKAFSEFRNNILVSYPDIYSSIKYKKVKSHEEVWTRWGLLFQLAALMHDCGHSPFSHTLEFIYDLAEDGNERELDKKLLSGMDDNFIADFQKGCCGKPHERMSALYIKTDEYSGMRSHIETLLKSYISAYQLGEVYEGHAQGIMNDDIEFMIRMIIGCRYNYDRRDEYYQKKQYMSDSQQNWYIELQLRNCIIGMLNSQLDVDNLDYVVRDSKFSGYANHAVDLERLLSSFTIVLAYQVDNLPITDKDKFDYCINLKKFSGKKLEGRLTGASHIFCENQNIQAHGRIILKDQEEKSDGDQRIYETTDNFSAELYFCDKAGKPIEITAPKESKRDCAYIHFKGKMDGLLTGTVFANEYKKIGNDAGWYTKGELKIYFAYEQKCMSVLMSAVYNSNFEKKWIYSHHISTYTNDFLYIYLLDKYAEYVVRNKRKELTEDMEHLINEAEYQEIDETPIQEINLKKMIDLKNNLQQEDEDQGLYEVIEKRNRDALVQTNNIIRELMRLCNELTVRRDELRGKLYAILCKCCMETSGPKQISGRMIRHAEEMIDKYKGLYTGEMQVFSDILAMYTVYDVDGMAFYKTSDRDLLAAYKNLYTKIINSPDKDRKEHKEFLESYEELVERRYLKCMWKSQPEFEYYFSNWTEQEKCLLRRQLQPSKAPKKFKYLVLSDNISDMSDFEKKFWEYLKEKFYFKRFVCVPQQIRTKRFVDYEMYMKRGNRVLRLKDVKLFNDDQGNFDFFYFYYSQSEIKEIDVFEILDWLKETIKEAEVDGY
ncbi:MAG: HD domain-containing protein [Lachnospiraceae bacterium]|nr:HD domain-containing protein [Lachnospiraceae bacterium]